MWRRKAHWTTRIDSDQSWDWARMNAARRSPRTLQWIVHNFVEAHFASRGRVERCREHLVAWPLGPERWLVRMRIVGERVAVYRWPAGGSEVEVDARPDALAAALDPDAPGPAAVLGDTAALAAYLWRCAWCEDVLRERFRGRIRPSAAPWLDDLLVDPVGPYQRLAVRAQPPFYAIRHGRYLNHPLSREVLCLDGPPDSDREHLRAAIEPRPHPS